MSNKYTPGLVPMKWNCHLLGLWTALRDGEFQDKDFPKVRRDVIRALNKHNKRVKRFQVPQDIFDLYAASKTPLQLSTANLALYDWAEARKVYVK